MGKYFVYQLLNPRNDHKSAMGSFKSELWNLGLFAAKPTKVSELVIITYKYHKTGVFPVTQKQINWYIPFLFVVTWFCAIDEAFLVRLDQLQPWQPCYCRHQSTLS